MIINVTGTKCQHITEFHDFYDLIKWILYKGCRLVSVVTKQAIYNLLLYITLSFANQIHSLYLTLTIDNQ